MSDKSVVSEKDKPFVLALVAIGATVAVVALSAVLGDKFTVFDKVFTFFSTLAGGAFGYYFGKGNQKNGNQAKPQ